MVTVDKKYAGQVCSRIGGEGKGRVARGGEG